MSKTAGRDPDKRFVRDTITLLAETAVFVFFVMAFAVQAFQIPSASMDPTLRVGDYLLVDKTAYRSSGGALDRVLLPRRAVRRGDIVVFKYPEDPAKDFVKRVVGMPGETVEIRRKAVFINGKLLPEAYAVFIDPAVHAAGDGSGEEGRDDFGPVTVPAGRLFVMGDNRDNSLDSRFWGFVPLSSVKGRPWIIYFSKAGLRRILKTIS